MNLAIVPVGRVMCIAAYYTFCVLRIFKHLFSFCSSTFDIILWPYMSISRNSAMYLFLVFPHNEHYYEDLKFAFHFLLLHFGIRLARSHLSSPLCAVGKSHLHLHVTYNFYCLFLQQFKNGDRSNNYYTKTAFSFFWAHLRQVCMQ